MKSKATGAVRNEQMIEGLLWNYGSIAVLSVSGFLFNILIMLFYDVTVLGIFNQAYAWYIVLSQLAVFGIQASVTRYCSEYYEDWPVVKKILASGLTGCVGISAVVIVLGETILFFLQSDRAALLTGIKTVILALGCFSANKVILGCLNGLSKMKAYAVFQSLRYLLIAVSICILAILKVNGEYLPLCFLIAEMGVLAVSMVYLFKKDLLGGKLSSVWLKRHLGFGIKILPSNFVLELNTKVDVICLGFILQDDYQIGIYSFAVLFAEGFYQIFIVIRRSLNPMITEYFVNHKIEDFVRNINKKAQKYLLFLSPLAGIVLLAGYCLVCYVLGKREYLQGILPLALIVGAIVISGKYIIYGNIFSQIGNPIYESIINLITVGTNIVLNVILIYLFGLIGAAIATAISYFAYCFALKAYVKNKMKLKL